MIWQKIITHRAFILLLAFRFLTTTATFIQSIAIGWQVYTVARLDHNVEQSSFLIGMVGLVQFLPLFFLSLIAGETADRYDRRKILLGCNLLQMTCALAFTIFSFLPTPPLALLFSMASLFGVARAFSMPASTSLAPMLVPAQILPRAIAWNTLSAQSGMILGPWLGGILCAFAPYKAYATAASLYLVAMLIISLLLSFKLSAKSLDQPNTRLTMIREGLSYLMSNRIVLGAISLDLFAVFFGGVTALLPVVARDVLHIGADGFGLLRSGSAIGGGLMTVLLSVYPIRRHAGPWILSSVFIYGVATIIFAFTRELWLSLTMLIVLGAADSISVFVRQSLVQIVTPDPMRGRVSSVSSLFISASNELGEFESGIAARIMGPIGSILFGGLGSLFITLLWSKLFPALRKADHLISTQL